MCLRATNVGILRKIRNWFSMPVSANRWVVMLSIVMVILGVEILFGIKITSDILPNIVATVLHDVMWAFYGAFWGVWSYKRHRPEITDVEVTIKHVVSGDPHWN